MISEFIKNISENKAVLFLVLLLCADLAFIALHSIETLSPYIDSALYSLETEGGYPEIYQCLKWFWIIMLLAFVVVSRRSWSYASWGAVFTYFLVDDGLSIHERVGHFIAGKLSFNPPLGLRLQDIGELAVSAAAGMILLSLVIWVYRRGTQVFKKVSRDMLMMLLAFAVFSVFFDMAHIAIKWGWKMTFFLGVIEDGGEMLVASLILWYTFLLSVRDEDLQSS